MAGVIGSRLVPIHHHHHRHTNTTTLIPTSLPQFNIQLKFPPAAAAIHSRRSMSATAIPTTNPPVLQHNHASTGCWSEFATNVSGEWDGFGADFTIDGNPIELPENVVPDAYREWEVKVFDWQTQCPTLAQPDNVSAIYKLIKLLPTVGCEADAATRYTIDERIIGGTDNMVSSFAYQSTGCYTAVWSIKKQNVLELEHCLIDPRDKQSRVRIIQIVSVDENTKKLVLKNIKVFIEQWYGPFRNGDQLGGCAIRDSAFAKTQVLDSSQISGMWQCSNSIARFQGSPNGVVQELVAVDGIEKLLRDEKNVVLLPKKLWSSVKETEDGDKSCEVGWLLETGRAITSKCILSRNAELKEIIISSETAAT